jgi:peptidoglycan/LPS O-acetylase OafA/YrhL
MRQQTDVSRPTRGYLPTLDGWRTLSIAAVMLCHDSLHHFGPFNTMWLYQHGNLGVDIFFAISGLLICSRLLEEEHKTGSISIQNFYVRRAFRILPPAMAFLAMLALLAWLINLPVGMPEIFASFFFVRNYTFFFQHFQTLNPFYTSHFWSLAVEEHFYLLLPALLVFAPKRWRVPLLFLLSVAVGVHRFLLGTAASVMHTDTRLDALVVPAAIAILLQKQVVRARLTPWLRFWPLLAIAVFGLVIMGWLPRLQPLALAWCCPFFVLGTMLRPGSLFGRFLELPVMRYFGRLSYSIYLWQQLFFVGHFGGPHPGLAVFQRWPLAPLMTIACAMLSYYFIERPAIRAGHHFAAVIKARKKSHRVLESELEPVSHV